MSGTVIGAAANDGATVLPGPTTPESRPAGCRSAAHTRRRRAARSRSTSRACKARDRPRPAGGDRRGDACRRLRSRTTLARSAAAGLDVYDVVTCRRSAAGSRRSPARSRPASATRTSTSRRSRACAPCSPDRAGPGRADHLPPGFLGSAWRRRERACPTRCARDAARRNGRSDLEGLHGAGGARRIDRGHRGHRRLRLDARVLEQIAPGRHAFAYDWRKSPAESLQALDALVDRVRGGGKVVLLGHSMGGLVTRMYIDDPARAAKVVRAVTLGTAYWGTPKALFLSRPRSSRRFPVRSTC